MTDKPMIPSEAITAGAIRQSMDNGERCPECGAPLDCVYPPVDHPIRKYRCGTSTKDGKVAQSHKCMLNQLAISRECERAALAREARLRRVVEDAQSAPQRAQEWMRANGVQVADPSVPMQRAVFEVYNLLVELAQQAEAALSSAPAAPPAAQERPERAFGKGEREC